MVLHLIPKIKTQNTMRFLAIDFQGEKNHVDSSRVAKQPIHLF